MVETVPSIDCKTFSENRSDYHLIDVRRDDEIAICEIGGQHIALDQLPDRWQEIPQDKPLVVHCRSGGRSAKAVAFLQQQGVKDVYNLDGGILAWIEDIDQSLTSY